MGDYRGRRRGRADSEPPQDGGYYADEAFGGSNYRDGYQESGDGYAEGQEAEYAADLPTDYAEPRFDFQQRTPAYEQPYGQQEYQPQEYEPQAYEPQAYEPQPYEPQPYGQQAHEQSYDPAYEQQHEQGYDQAYAPEQFYAPEPEPSRGSRRGRPAAEPEYTPGYLPGYAPEDLAYEPGYDAPPFDEPALPAIPAQPEPRRSSRRGRPADEAGRFETGAPDDGHGRDEYGQGEDHRDEDHRDEDRRGEGRSGAAAPNHLPVVGAIAVAVIVCGFVSPKAVAAVTIVLQVAAAFAVRDILRLPGRRAAILAAVPAVAATVGTFKFSSDVAATAVAAGLGAGFVLAAGDLVLRSRKRGVQPGSTRALAGSVAALLVATMTALLTAAARQSSVAAAIGGVVYGVLAVLTARDRDLTASRTAVLGLPAAGAALAAYAAAILVA